MFARERKCVELGAALEEIIRRLNDVQRRVLQEFQHLPRREVAHANGLNFAAPVELGQRARGLFHWNVRVGPMDLIDVDVVGT